MTNRTSSKWGKKRELIRIRKRIADLIETKGPLRIDDLMELTEWDRPVVDLAVKFLREKKMIKRCACDLGDMRKCFYDIVRGNNS